MSDATSGAAWDLPPTPANFEALTPVDFLDRAASVYPTRIAVIDGERSFTYAEFGARCRRLASALQGLGVEPGEVVSVLAPNGVAMLEAHYGVPMAGAVLNALNYRLDAATIGYILGHAETRVLLADRAFAAVVDAALAGMENPPLVIAIDDPAEPATGLDGAPGYEALLAGGDPAFTWHPPADEWLPISLSYTSGTTGKPKGVVYHHRGAYLNALSNAFVFAVDGRSRYLWTLPMFHCNGWTFTWAVTAAGGTHVCLRQVDPAEVFRLIETHRVTHLCGAPIVLNMLVHAPDEAKRSFPQTVQVATGGAAPPGAVIEAMERMGFRVMHLYGLTETYGPATLCVEQDDWEGLDIDGRAAKMARQGVRYPTLAGLRVVDLESGEDVADDGESLGEIWLRGNTVMAGYLKDPAATAAALADGWFRSGDLAVRHADGYIEIRDRAKDIIISGGENISSLEVEEVLYRHPSVMEAAVVARPDDYWGETPCAFVTLRPDAGEVAADAIITWCRDHLAHYKVPKTVLFGPLPKTSTGKIQKFELRAQAKKIEGEAT